MLVTTVYPDKAVQITVKEGVDRTLLEPITLRFAVNRQGNRGMSFGIEAPQSQYLITVLQGDKYPKDPTWAEQPIELVPAYALVYSPTQPDEDEADLGGAITLRWRKNHNPSQSEAATLTVEHQPGAYRVEAKLRQQLQPKRNRPQTR